MKLQTYKHLLTRFFHVWSDASAGVITALYCTLLQEGRSISWIFFLLYLHISFKAFLHFDLLKDDFSPMFRPDAHYYAN